MNAAVVPDAVLKSPTVQKPAAARCRFGGGSAAVRRQLMSDCLLSISDVLFIGVYLSYKSKILIIQVPIRFYCSLYNIYVYNTRIVLRSRIKVNSSFV